MGHAICTGLSMSNTPRQEASLTVRARMWFSALPLVCMSVLVICIGLSVVSLLTGDKFSSPVCLNAYLVVQQLQVYRVFTSAFVHDGILHVAFNMLTFVPIASSLERQLGSAQFAYVVLLFLCVGNGAFFTIFAYAAAWLLQIGQAGCAVGLSGVIFALLVVDTHVSGAQQRSIFGLFPVPALYFPWALLILWQLLLPHVSFFGHLGGLLAGQCFVWGWLHWAVPSSSLYQAVERSWPCRLLTTLDSFIWYSGGFSLPTSYAAASDAAQSVRRSLAAGTSTLQGWLRLPTSDPEQEAAGQATGHQAAGTHTFAGHGHILGGVGAQTRASEAAKEDSSGPTPAAPPTNPAWPGPNAAAAAAAEARASQGSAKLLLSARQPAKQAVSFDGREGDNGSPGKTEEWQTK